MLVSASTSTQPSRPQPVSRGVSTFWLAPLLAAGVLACVLALLVGGGAAPLEVGDPGPLARWGTPLLRVLHDLAAAVTIGALMYGGLLMPEGAHTSRRRATARIAATWALLWGVAGVLGGMLAYLAIAQGGASQNFLSGWWTSTWQLELLRAPAVTAILALVVALGALVEHGRNGQAWLCGLAVLSVLPLALAGHSATSSDHDASVNSLAFHLVGAAVWVGGLIVLLVMWSSLGSARASVVARYSRIATWCYVAVGLSGLLNAAIRLGSWSALGTRYGALVLAKTAALLILGGFGYLQRKRVVEVLSRGEDGGDRGQFRRLASGETLVMAATVGIATALARTETPVPQTATASDPVLDRTGYATPPDYTAVRLLLSWRTEWLFTTMAVVAIGVYLAWVLRLHRRGDRWPVGRTVAWVAGWLLLAYVVSSGLGIYGRVMFSVHMLQHMLFSMAVPLLMVLAAPVTLALRALPKRSDQTLGCREIILGAVHSTPVRVLANPVVAAAVFFLSLVVFYFSPLFGLAMETHTGHVLMTMHFLIAGYLFVWSLIGIDPGPPKLPAPLRLLVLLVTLAAHAFFGVALMSSHGLLAPGFFSALDLPWVHSPIEDQQAGGGVAWAAGELPTVILAILVTRDWLRSDTAEARRRDRQAERDDDAELRAYNDYLASRREGGPR